ncbi:MAG: Fic family protein [Bacteroidetes bacterium]|nr:Fic family protein [Bacteroidota bacterium]
MDWNYHSNAIEGNKLTYGETVAFLLEGTTAKAKPLKDHLDIKGHDEAVKYLISLVKDKNYLLTETEIRNLHKLLLKEPYWVDAVTPDGLSTRKEIKIGEYKSSTNHVITPTGETHYYATPEQTPIMMGELMEWYKDAKEDKAIHPLILASLFHHQFVAIHPFDDGNGRMARLLMNMMLMQETYPPVVVKQEDRQNYYQVLRQADAGELIPICEYMSNLLKHSLTIYIKGAKGESIAEEDDVDKEVALFKKSLGEDLAKQKVSEHVIKYQVENSIIPLIISLINKFQKNFKDLFNEENIQLLVQHRTSSHQNINPVNGFGYNDIFSIFSEPEGLGRKYNFNIYQLMIEFYYQGFKKSKEPFSTHFSVPILFDEYNYRINYRMQSGAPVISKLYHDVLTQDEISMIANKSVKLFLENIKYQIKS